MLGVSLTRRQIGCPLGVAVVLVLLVGWALVVQAKHSRTARRLQSGLPLRLRRRPDLESRRHRYDGRAYWVVKEPVGLNYFRFHEEEFAILNMLRSLATPSTAAAISAAVQEAIGDDTALAAELRWFFVALAASDKARS